MFDQKIQEFCFEGLCVKILIRFACSAFAGIPLQLLSKKIPHSKIEI
jgi:hypothetical protein